MNPHTLDPDLSVGLLSEVFLRARRNLGAVGYVSTYTSVMGATGNIGPIEMTARVSTHAPVMGTTSRPWDLAQLRQSFNPRARDGRDMAMAA